jgi:hypothetical protein
VPQLVPKLMADNLNTHNKTSFYEALPVQIAAQIARELSNFTKFPDFKRGRTSNIMEVM